jgi:hypothetical protein
MLGIAWLALKPFLGLQERGPQERDRKWWDGLMLSPILFVTTLIVLTLACGLRSGLSFRGKDIAVIERNRYQVRLISDCDTEIAPCSLHFR